MIAHSLGGTSYVTLLRHRRLPGEANINLTADHAYQVGRFLGWYYNEKRAHAAEEGRPVKEGPARIVIGKDTRRSSYMFE